jgi:hypothetical protein
MGLYVLTFIFLDGRWDDKNSETELLKSSLNKPQINV